MNNLVRIPSTRTPSLPAGLIPAPEAGFSGPFGGRPFGPEWIGKGPAAAGIPTLTAPAPTGRCVEEGPFAGRVCGEEFIGRGPGCAGLPTIDSLPGAYTAPAQFGEIGRMVTL